LRSHGTSAGAAIVCNDASLTNVVCKDASLANVAAENAQAPIYSRNAMNQAKANVDNITQKGFRNSNGTRLWRVGGGSD
jgi:hypothetical protein